MPHTRWRPGPVNVRSSNACAGTSASGGVGKAAVTHAQWQPPLPAQDAVPGKLACIEDPVVIQKILDHLKD